MLIMNKHKLYKVDLIRLMIFWLAFAVLAGCTNLKVSKVESVNIRLDSTLKVVPDPKVEAYIVPFREKLNKDMGEVLCRAKDPLFGGRPESSLTNFCSDLVLIESDSICMKKFPGIHLDVAMVNKGGLRVPIPKGEVTVRNMFELMPFENEVVFLKLTGEQLNKFIDHLASRGGEGVAGMRFGIKDNKGLSPEIQGKPLDVSKTYWMVTSDYIANGGDGCEVLTAVKERVIPGVRFRDMFIDHLRKLGKKNISIVAKMDGRVYDAK